MISLGYWNVRLVVDPPSKQREVRHLLKTKNLSFCGLVETKRRSINKDMISRKALWADLKSTSSVVIDQAWIVMGDFRPISCFNTIYKCITKLIANRIKDLLPKIISPTQSAFVEGRKIQENVLLAQELLRNYHRKTGKPRCTIKFEESLRLS